MKNFLISFLGALAGIWFSLFLAVIGIFIVIAAAMASSGGNTTVNVSNNSVLCVDLSGTIYDRAPKIDIREAIRGGGLEKNAQVLADITGAVTAAASDDRIEGIVMNCSGVSAGIAQLTAIIEALKDFKKNAPEKWIYAYADAYAQGDYYVASVADSVFINPVGMVEISGLSLSSLYYKRLLDKLGVDMQVVKVGTYKSAVEPYLLDRMSDPAREQAQLFLKNIWNDICTTIADARGVTVADVNKWADDFVFTKDASTYKDLKIVDGLLYRHEFDRKIADLTGCDKIKDIKTITTAQYAKIADSGKVGSGKGANIAVLYATGEITDNSGNGIVASELVPEILELAEDNDIDGLIMYVNSPGGSAFASEQIWEALEQYKKLTGNPFYVSMADYAASGGYYISCGADRIFAQPVTLTGSIGIFGMIPDISGLVNDKIGIGVSTVTTNPNSNFPTILEPMTEAQKASMQAYVNRGYELFTSRCAEGRGMSQDSIKAIGEGRVWDGTEALKLGLVDELGGLDTALAAMARQLNVESYTVHSYPVAKDKWYDLLLEAGIEDIKAAIMRQELGEMCSLYDAIRQVKGMSVLQCRMEFTKVNL
ncbi:signal peptide peptidase SppA [Duncaniella muris]|uniref:signal peptide peptidase SppA n=1 Tax=Duncaniella muris TaxID=2094150 RepID=UPI002715308C|nr:signal peptide peptidase SppA [Duncaniella muris]